MSTQIGKQLKQKLAGASGQEHTSVDASGGGVSVAVDVERCERYAVGVEGVRIRPDTPVENVGEAAERIARNVDVIDPLRVVEYEASTEEAILRSAEPAADEGGVTYWEANVKPDETTLHRFHKAHDEPDRRVVVEPMTHGEAGAVVEQIADALKGDPT